MKLYYNPISIYSQKVIMALSEKALPFERFHVQLEDPIKNKEYRAIYPLGKVPCLQLDNEPGDVIGESTSIIERLDERFPEIPLIPKEGASQVRHIDRLVDMYLIANMSLLFFQSIKPVAQQDADRIATAKYQIHIALKMLEAIKEKSANPKYMVGNSLTLADVSLIPALSSMGNVAELAEFSALNHYLELHAERESLGVAREGQVEAVQKIAAALS